MVSIRVSLQPDASGGFVVGRPILDVCYSQTDDIDEALADIREAIELRIDELEPRGSTVPDPTRILSSTVYIVG